MSNTLWNFDYAHSTVNFVARHMVVARVFGRFSRFSGKLSVDPANMVDGGVEVELEAASIDTNNPDRDNHLRSPDFLDVARYPKISFKSTRVEGTGGASFRLHGELTIRDVTKPVVLEARNLGSLKDPWGLQRVLFNAKGTVNRADFGITWNKALDNGGWLISEKIDVEFDVQATAV